MHEVEDYLQLVVFQSLEDFIYLHGFPVFVRQLSILCWNHLKLSTITEWILFDQDKTKFGSVKI